ncbi:MAG: GIY-YIG nuclease family protein [Alphaproteobacteria bacterium]
MQIFVYILRCSDNSYYVGLAREGLEKRLSEHELGKYRGYTFTRCPVQLVWSEEFVNLTDAIACERRIKGWRREKKEALIRGDFAALPQLSKTAKNPHPSTGSG